ncbi:hypothetical protein DFH09DRAFT_1099260 [Mycena vulgaris]|nr:hypothetical protein DFH09DRAFT_1099260 [Mycena vulgaris]
MAFTLPVETLANMTVMFKVGLADGTFAFDMAPENARDMAGLQLETSGLKLHPSAVRDSAGVTITLFTSGNSSSRLNEGSLDPSAFGVLLPACPGHFSSHLIALNSNDSNVPYFGHTGGHDPPTESILSPFLLTDAEDSAATTPRTSSEASRTYSPPLPALSSRLLHVLKISPLAPRGDQRSSLKAHAPNAQSFACDMGCIMSFSRKHDHVRHEMTQHGRVCEWGGFEGLLVKEDAEEPYVLACIDYGATGMATT